MYTNCTFSKPAFISPFFSSITKIFATFFPSRDEDDRKSISGYVILLGGNIIAWRSKKQGLVALSTLKSEYYALLEVVKELKWLRGLLGELGYHQLDPTIVHEDNNGCIATAHNPKHHNRTKHINIKYHFVRDEIQKGTFCLEHCPSGDMTADILTKPLPKEKHTYHMGHLRLHAATCPLKEEC